MTDIAMLLVKIRITLANAESCTIPVSVVTAPAMATPVVEQ
jgi:hypothetical protein